MARVALLISGLPRQWEHCVQSQLALFQTTPCDVFFHFWDTVDAAEKPRILTAYQPKAHRFEAQQDFSRFDQIITNYDSINCPSRMMSMYASWKAVGEVFTAYQRESGVQYDYAVRLRSDLMFFQSIEGVLTNVRPDTLVLTTFNNFGLVNDTFAVGGIAPILYYHSLADHMLEYNRERTRANPERMLIRHLTPPKNTKYRIGLMDLKVLVFRAHMVGMPIEECLRQDPGATKWTDPEIVAWHRKVHGGWYGSVGLRHVDEFVEAKLSCLPPPISQAQSIPDSGVNQAAANDSQEQPKSE